MTEKINATIEFEKVKIKGKEDWEDAECSECGKGFAISEKDLENFSDKSKGQLKGYAYCYHQENWGGIQLCQECFDRLGKLDNFLEELKELFLKYNSKGVRLYSLINQADLFIDTVKKESEEKNGKN